MKKISSSLVCSMLALSVAASTGCASKASEPSAQLGTEVAPFHYQPDMRSYHSSWGHTGRGGAAVRKPAYVHVLATPAVLEVPAGKLYPSITSLDDLALPAITQPETASQAAAVRIDTVTPFEEARPCNAGYRVIASAREMTDDYIQVRNKLCAGAERLTFEEWEILVNGTPKDIPAHLKLAPFQTIFSETKQ